MKEKIIILLIFLSFYGSVVKAQCPINDTSVENEIKRKISGHIEVSKKLIMLLAYRDKIVQCHNEHDSLDAWVLHLISKTYKEEGDFSNAVKYLLQSINLNKWYVNNYLMDAGKLITDYYWLSTYYDSLNNATERRKVIDSCLSFKERFHYSYDASSLRCLLDRLQHFYDIGEYMLCINDAGICEKAASQYTASVKNPGYKIVGTEIAQNSFHWHINALLQLKDFSTVANLLSDKATEYKKSGNLNYLALTYQQVALMLEKKGDYSQALYDLNFALKIYRSTKDIFNCKQTLNTIGEEIYFKHLKDYDKALLYYKKAITCISHDQSWQNADTVESLNIFRNIANVYVEKKLFDSASIYFQLAFDKIKKGTNITNILNITTNELASQKKINYLIDLLINYGDSYKKKYEFTKENKELERAIYVYTIVDKLLAMINISQFEADSRLLWRRDSRRLYENAIEACYMSNKPEKAFYFFERSRAVLLNIQLEEQKWMGKNDIASLNELNQKITLLNHAINELSPDKQQNSALQDTLRNKKDEMYNLLQLIKSRYPLYYQNQDTAILTIAELQKKLSKDQETMLEIFSGDSAVYSLLVTSNQSVITKIDKNEFEKAVALYTGYLSNYEQLNKDFDHFRIIAHHLFTLIFQNNPPAGRIIVSPEGSYFPFESLITSNSSVAPVYFIASHAVSYTYSARYLFNNFASANIAGTGNFLGVAPVQFSADFHLAELTGSDISLKNIEPGLDRSGLLLQKDASKNNFLQQFPGYLIIQLYTHASDSSSRKEPVIYFSDSALYLSDLVLNARPVTQLIVLSACETGNGKLYQGEGVFSFNRGFAALGIPSSVTNLWSINSKATYALTELFYKNLSKGLPLDIALQKAKLEYMNDDSGENQLPYFWAAPVLVGKTDPVKLNKPFEWNYVFAGTGLALLCFFGIKKLRKIKWITPAQDTIQTAA